jgi:hypothetical protein
VENSKSELCLGRARRLKLIEFRLFWAGHVIRIDLMQTFKLSVKQASADLNRLIGLVLDKTFYGNSARTNVGGIDFEAQLLVSDAIGRSRHSPHESDIPHPCWRYVARNWHKIQSGAAKANPTSSLEQSDVPKNQQPESWRKMRRAQIEF